MIKIPCAINFHILNALTNERASLQTDQSSQVCPCAFAPVINCRIKQRDREKEPKPKITKCTAPCALYPQHAVTLRHQKKKIYDVSLFEKERKIQK